MEYSPREKVWKLMGRKDHIECAAVLLSVINQCTRACEMEDSWKVRYSSQREQLRPRQSYDVSFILSVWCLASSLLLALSCSHSPSLWAHTVSHGGYDEAQLSLSHTAQRLLGDYTIQ